MPDPKLADLVLEGGGVKGVGLGGAYIAFREAGYTAANVAGTSAVRMSRIADGTKSRTS